MNINKIIPIVVRISPAGLQTSNFGKCLLLGQLSEAKQNSGLVVNSYRTYGNVGEVAADFDTTTQVYRAASSWFSVVPKPKDIVIGIRDDVNDSLVESLTKMSKQTWFYWFGFTSEAYVDNEAIKSCAIWGDTNSKFLINSQTNPNLSDATNTGDVATELNTQGSRHVFTEFNNGSGDIDPYAGFSTAALFARINFSAPDSTITAEYKVKPGTTSMQLNTDQESALEAKKVVFYTDITAGESTDHGNVKNSWTHSAYGEYIDDVFNLDAFINDLQVSVYNVLRGSLSKIGQDPRGQRQLIAAAQHVGERYIANGYLGEREFVNPDTGETQVSRGYEILTKPSDIYDISKSDRSARKMAPIRIRVFRRGAAHVADITVDTY